MSPHKISVERDGKVIEGKISVRDKFYLEVEITKPYVNYLNRAVISGNYRRSPNHFLTEYGDKRVKELLVEIYEKLKRIDKSIDRIVELYDDYLEEVALTGYIEKEGVRAGIHRKLKDAVFYSLFGIEETGLVATNIYDRDKLFEIIEVYKKEKRKLYLGPDIRHVKTRSEKISIQEEWESFDWEDSNRKLPIEFFIKKRDDFIREFKQGAYLSDTVLDLYLMVTKELQKRADEKKNG